MLPLKFPIKVRGLEHKIFGLVRSFSGLKTGKISFLGTPLSMGNFNGNALASKLPKKAKDRTFKHYTYITWRVIMKITGYLVSVYDKTKSFK